MTLAPCELKDANQLIASWHRHHKPVQGHRWSVKVSDESGTVHGAAICGRPVARMTDQHNVLEITRLVTDGTPNACSFLYGAVRRIAKQMGFKKVQTFILDSESGTSLKAAGYHLEALSAGGDWTREGKPNRRQDQPQCSKQKWSVVL